MLPRYAGFLLDAYGVLVDARGALPAGQALVRALERSQKPFWVVTNDSSRLETTCAARFASHGLAIPAERIVTSGGLLTRFFAERKLQGKRCGVLGTPDSHAYVERAGGVLSAWDAPQPLDVLVVADDSGYPFMESINAALSAVTRSLDAGLPVTLVLPNPDCLYPAGEGRVGATSGAVAAMFEASLLQRYPTLAPTFHRLGKPYGGLFEEAIRRAGTAALCMVGDQLATDILGATRAGLDSALVDWGLGRHEVTTDSPLPTWWLTAAGRPASPAR